MWDASLPGHSCGGSGGFEPPSLLGLVSQATRDVRRSLSRTGALRNDLDQNTGLRGMVNAGQPWTHTKA